MLAQQQVVIVNQPPNLSANPVKVKSKANPPNSVSLDANRYPTPQMKKVYSVPRLIKNNPSNKSSYQLANSDLEKKIKSDKNSRNTRSRVKDNTQCSINNSVNKTTVTEKKIKSVDRLITNDQKANLSTKNSRNKPNTTIQDSSIQHFRTTFGVPHNQSSKQNLTIKDENSDLKNNSLLSKGATKPKPIIPIYQPVAKKGIIDMSIKTDVKSSYPTSTQNKILDKLISNIKTKFEKDISDKRYPPFRIREDISKILFNSTSININWDNYDTLVSKTASAFEKIIKGFRSCPGVVDINKINSLINDKVAGLSKANKLGYNIITGENSQIVNNDLINQSEKLSQQQNLEPKNKFSEEKNIDENKENQRYVNNTISTSANNANENNLNANNKINDPDKLNSNQIVSEKNFLSNIQSRNPISTLPNNLVPESYKTFNKMYAKVLGLPPKAEAREQVKSSAYYNLLKQQLGENLKMKQEADFWSQETAKDWKNNQINEKTQKETQAKKIKIFKEQLDKQIQEKAESKKRAQSAKKDLDTKIILDANKEKEEENASLLKKQMTKIEQSNQLKKHEEEKRKRVAEEKAKEQNLVNNIISYNNKKLEKENQVKEEVQQRNKQHWNEFNENNNKLHKERVASKKREKDLEGKALKDLDALLTKQEETRKNEREKLLNKISNTFIVNAGMQLEKQRNEKLILEEEKRILAEKTKLVRESEEESKKRLERERRLNSFREGLNKQIKEKNLIKQDKKKNDNEFFTKIVLKADTEDREHKKSMIDQLLTKQNLYKQELDRQVKEREQFKLLKNYGITGLNEVNLNEVTK